MGDPSKSEMETSREEIGEPAGSSGEDVKTLEKVSSDEVPEQGSGLLPDAHHMMAKEILSNKARSYLSKSKKSENTLSQITFSLGMGSIWRFPYLCHKNGAGSFILIYIFMLLLLGVPLLCMEMIIAHWLQANNIQTWEQLVPSLGGIGYVSVLICFFLSSYYSILVTWNFFYLVSAFDFPLPWDYCSMGANKTDLSCLQTVSPHYFWYETVLRGTDYIESGVQVLVLHLLLLNFTIWFFVFLMMLLEVHHSMVMQIFSLFLLLFLLLCLLIRGFFLGTAISGLSHMITTKVAWSSLDLWRQAGSHVLYSLGLGLGAINIPAYKPVNNNYFFMASLVALVNLIVSLLATSIIFIILEFWITSSGQACVLNSVAILKQLISKQQLPANTVPPASVLQGPPLGYIEWVRSLRWPLQNQVVLSAPSCSIKVHKNKFLESPSLAFVAFSQAVALWSGPNFWAVLFFLSQFIMGLSSMKRVMDSVTVPLQGSFSMALQYRKAFLVIICLSGFLGSTFYASQSGSFVFHLFDDYLVPLCLVLIVIFQTVTLVCIYGIHRVRERLFYDIGLMLWPLFTFLWCYVVLPVLLLLGLLAFIAFSQNPVYILWNNTLSEEVKHPFPTRTWSWVLYICFMIFLPIPVYLCYQYLTPPSVHTTSGNTQEQWSKGQSAMLPTSVWSKTEHEDTEEHPTSSTPQVSQRNLWRTRRINSWTFRGGSFIKEAPNSLELPQTRDTGSSSYGSHSQLGQESITETTSSHVGNKESSRESLSGQSGNTVDTHVKDSGTSTTLPALPETIPEHRQGDLPK